MSFEQFKQSDVELMHDAQRIIVQAVLPLVDRGVHPLLIVFALARCLRVLLRKTTIEEQAAVRPAIFHFIAGATEAPASSQRGATLWTPEPKNN